MCVGGMNARPMDVKKFPRRRRGHGPRLLDRRQRRRHGHGCVKQRKCGPVETVRLARDKFGHARTRTPAAAAQRRVVNGRRKQGGCVEWLPTAQGQRRLRDKTGSVVASHRDAASRIVRAEADSLFDSRSYGVAVRFLLAVTEFMFISTTLPRQQGPCASPHRQSRPIPRRSRTEQKASPSREKRESDKEGPEGGRGSGLGSETLFGGR